jgi:hypothetical protein
MEFKRTIDTYCWVCNYNCRQRFGCVACGRKLFSVGDVPEGLLGVRWAIEIPDNADGAYALYRYGFSVLMQAECLR